MKIILFIISIGLMSLIIWFWIPYSSLKKDFKKETLERKTEYNLFSYDEAFSLADFKDLPKPVQKYLEHNKYLGKKKMSFVKMEYHNVAFRRGHTGLILQLIIRNMILPGRHAAWH